jgi:5-formaminoimidazole-4-carboxamide-1-(beta)-D-ribofuranosyl 5'-monophosphate synthetase
MINLKDILREYRLDDIHIGTLGGHSALDLAAGAKKEGFKTVVVCEEGRDKTYTRHYQNLFDEAILVEKFSHLTDTSVVEKLQKLNTIFVQSRYFWVYCNHQEIESSFNVPIFGTRGIVKLEERDVPKNQYYLMEKAGIRFPKIFEQPEEIDRLVLVKAPEAQRSYERAFFFATNQENYIESVERSLAEGAITVEGLKKAVIEEYIIGAQVNFNFFYSRLKKRLELMGVDSRRQTNLDGLIRLPAREQIAVLQHVKPQYVETGHMAVTVKESILEKAFELGERLVEVLEEEYPPGIIGPFALQAAIIPGPPKEEIVTFDLSLRIPGSPGTMFTPYAYYLHGENISVGQRVAMEINEAVLINSLDQIVT